VTVLPLGGGSHLTATLTCAPSVTPLQANLAASLEELATLKASIDDSQLAKQAREAAMEAEIQVCLYSHPGTRGDA